MLRHITFGKGKKTLAILIATKDLNHDLLLTHYVKPLEVLGIPREQIVALSLDKNKKGKAPMTIITPCLDQLEKVLTHEGITHVICADSSYFKPLAKVRKTEPNYGYILPTKWSGITTNICLNYCALFFNPMGQDKIDMALKATAGHMLNTGGLFDQEVLIDCEYPDTDLEVMQLIEKYGQLPALTCDIETYSLKVDKAGLGTIAFAKDEHTGFGFFVGNNKTRRHYLKEFFLNYKGKLIFHGSTFDCKILIWELFMEHPRDYEGMLRGLHTMFRNLEDTKIVAYLALNTTAGISLSLKDLSFAHTGNYAQEDIKDITKIPMKDLLEYNVTDGVATWYVYNKHRPTVLNEQEIVYQELFLPALKVLTQMELCGMPINLDKVLFAEHKLDNISHKHYTAIMSDPLITDFNKVLRVREAEKANKTLKVLRKTADDFLDLEFNPNSNTQLALLLHGHLDLPILETTHTGTPSTTSKVLQALAERVRKGRKWSKEVGVLINHIIEYHDVDKILNTFIPAFKNNSINKDSWHYLHGCFNLGGAKSGRLSSSDPNLTNIPSTGTQYAKDIKQGFQAPAYPTDDSPTGWIVVGADFASLEDKVSALQTKDPNKLKIYTDGYDGHCLRAHKYFGDRMEGIDPDSVDSINAITTKYPDLRQDSKSPTFLLTYMGTYFGLMKQFGFSKVVAKQIEADYHELYAVSDKWVMDQIREAGRTGFVELAFGLKLRTPMLPQIVIDSESIPYQARKEIKTAGNALGQSYGLLNTRSANEFMERVWDSKYATGILPICQIHDSQYFMIWNTLGCLKYVNDNLIECMEWNKLTPIQHPTIKLSANLEVYYPDWGNPIPIPNRQSIKQLKTLLQEQKNE